MTFNAVDNKLDTTKSLTIASERQKNPLEININDGSSHSSIINDAMREAQVSLQGFAASSDFVASMNTAFGKGWDAKTVSKLQQGWLIANFGDLPQIKISGELDVIGANGAYASKTDTIYLSQGFLERNAHNIGEIKSVLLEEIGHAVDFRINLVDAAGDEGDIFQKVVQKQSLSVIDLSIMKAENDYATININSESLTIEMSRIEAIAFNNRLYQSIRGTDNGVYTRSTSDGNNWTGWVHSGGTINTPELEVFKNRLYQTVRGTDNGVYTRSTSDGNNWTGWVHSGGALNAPDLKGFNDRLYQTVRGTDEGVYTRSTSDGSNWTSWERNGNGLDAPELEEFKGRLYQTVLGGDKGVYTRSTSDGRNWTGWERSGNALNAPELEEFKGRLYQTVRGGDEGVYTRSTADGRNWTSWERSGNGLDAPELEVFNNRLYQTIRGGDQGTYTRSTFDGINWTSWERSGVGLSSSNFTVFNNRFFQHVEGIDSKIYVRSLGNSPNAAWTDWREFGGWTFGEGGSPPSLSSIPLDTLSLSRDQQKSRLGVNTSSSAYQASGNKFVKSNGTGGTYLWCTDYAFGRALEKGLLQNNSGIGGSIRDHAGLWDNNVGQGNVKSQARNNSIVVWDPWTGGTKNYGHVAFVEEVYSDGSFLISESNYGLTDKMSFKMRHVKPGTEVYKTAKFIHL
jgi:surface antigen